MSELLSEVLVPRRVVRQPSPGLYPGGDCGACCLAGLLGISVPEAYQRFQEEVRWFSYWDMAEALQTARSQGLVDRVVDAPPEWRTDHPVWNTWGNPGWLHDGPWFNYLRMAFDAGYHAVAPVDLTPQGATHSQGPDHWVLLCGARVRQAGIQIHREILVSCSARHPEGRWIEARLFLRHWGGFNALLARPVI